MPREVPLPAVLFVPLQRSGQSACGEIQVDDPTVSAIDRCGRGMKEERLHGEQATFRNATNLVRASRELGNAIGCEKRERREAHLRQP